MHVQDVMTDRVYRVLADTSADDAWNIMRMRRIHHLVVVNQSGHTVGLLSARDFSELKGTRARELHTVAELMTPHVVAVSPTTPLHKAAQLMRGHSIGCLVVLTAGHVVGIVTLADLLDQVGYRYDRPADTSRHRKIHHRTSQINVST